VSNLFARDEMDEILEELVPVMKKEFPRRAQTNENLYSYYNSRVRRHLHVVLCFSPVRITIGKKGISQFTIDRDSRKKRVSSSIVAEGRRRNWRVYTIRQTSCNHRANIQQMRSKYTCTTCAL